MQFFLVAELGQNFIRRGRYNKNSIQSTFTSAPYLALDLNLLKLRPAHKLYIVILIDQALMSY